MIRPRRRPKIPSSFKDGESSLSRDAGLGGGGRRGLLPCSRFDVGAEFGAHRGTLEFESGLALLVNESSLDLDVVLGRDGAVRIGEKSGGTGLGQRRPPVVERVAV